MAPDRDTPRRPQTRITAFMPADGWRLVTVAMTQDGAYAGVRCEPITAWVAVEQMGTEEDPGEAYVTHIPWWSPQDGAWWPEKPHWWDIGYLAPGATWEPAEWDSAGREAYAAHQTELAARRAAYAARGRAS
jgi:hypothetical protein